MPDLHADAATTLAGWRAPTASQAALAQACLAFLAARPDACDRRCAPGHLTASAVVFSSDLTRVALVLHRIVGRWLQPGGHLEPDDASVADAARREVREELGVEVDLDPVPVTLDCHPIACRGYTEPTRHLDVRFAARAVPDAALATSPESSDAAWWPVDALPDGLPAELAELVERGRHRLAGADGG